MSRDPGGWDEFWAETSKLPPHQIMDAYTAEIGRRLEHALHQLRETPGSDDAAGVLAAIMADPGRRKLLAQALEAFDCARAPPPPALRYRQGDLVRLADDLSAAQRDVDRLANTLMFATMAFREVPRLPDEQRVSNAYTDANRGLSELMATAHQLSNAVLAAHGPDKGQRPISDRHRPRALDRLVEDLARLWLDAGRRLEGADRRAFSTFVAALREAIDGVEDAEPDAREKAITRAKKNL